MPNYVRNVVSFGDERVLKDCIVDKKAGKTFDFNKIIPMPEELDPDSDRFLEKLSLEEQLLFLKENDGTSDWYNWRLKNWDTKWNAIETVVLNKRKVVFDTAWSAPFNVLRKISEKYHTKVTVRYADECITENSGKVIYEDGIEIDYAEGNRAFAHRVWNV